MIGPLTLRLQQDGAMVSLDDGLTASLPAEVARELERRLEQVSPDLTWFLGQPTAALLGTVGEAQQTAPRRTSRRPSLEQPRGEGRTVSVGDAAGEPSRSFAEVLRIRRSSRALGGLRLDALASVLVLSGRVRAWAESDDGYQITHRPTPSAGGRHPCDLLVAAPGVEGLAKGWWVFDATRCELHQEREGVPPMDQALDSIVEIGRLGGRPGAVIFLVAHFDRTLARYPAGGALVWRDAGVLLSVLHLCATALSLGSCIVGSAGVVRVQRSPSVVMDVGAIALGSDLSAV